MVRHIMFQQVQKWNKSKANQIGHGSMTTQMQN